MEPKIVDGKILLVPKKTHEIELAKEHMQSELAVALFRTIRNFKSDSYYLQLNDTDVENTLFSMFDRMRENKKKRKS